MDFRRRLRVVVNLLKNSRNEVVDTPNGDAGNRMPANLRQVENIILSGEIADSIMIDNDVRQNFNVIQMEEERQKLQFTKEHPEHSAGLFQLEDHYLLQGRTDLVGYENTHLYQRFIHVFDRCSRDIIDCAMLATYDYSQRINNWCIQLGSGNQDEIRTLKGRLLQAKRRPFAMVLTVRQLRACRRRLGGRPEETLVRRNKYVAHIAFCKSEPSRHSAEKRNPENILKAHRPGGRHWIPLFSGMTA